jgi:hypothetical protein
VRMRTDPPFPEVVPPEVMTTFPPLPPAATLPEDNTMDPAVPVADAVEPADRSKVPPSPPVDDPARMDTAPPIAEVPDVCPADSVTDPPLPDAVEPTAILMLPAPNVFPFPLANTTLPALPALPVPVRITTEPDTFPDAVTLVVDTVIPPLTPPVPLLPPNTSSWPPVWPAFDDPPADRKMPPPPTVLLFPDTMLMGPAVPPVAVPVEMNKYPEALLVVAPVLMVMLPDTPTEVWAPVAIVIVPLVVFPSPPSNEIAPLLPTDAPDATTIVPDTPEPCDVVPELRSTVPLAPAVVAPADTTDNNPLLAVPEPDTIRTSPPVLVAVVAPASNVKWPSEALFVEPTTTLMLPAKPLSADPAATTMLPTAPTFVVPVLNVILPEAPFVVDGPVRTSIEPVDEVASPDEKTMAPLTPAAFPLAFPVVAYTNPVPPVVVEPVLSRMLPVGPDVAASAVTTVTAPLPPDEEVPDCRLMAPPVLEPSTDTSMFPPALLEGPTTKDTDPATALVAPPVQTLIEPVVPEVAVPVVTKIEPEEPAPETVPDCTSKLPEAEVVEVPVDTLTPPIVVPLSPDT